MITTEDGSHSIYIPDMNVTYHSVHGAIQESKHVFIDAGLDYLINHSAPQPLNIFEMGLGTGLNAFLTAIEAGKQKLEIYYTAVEQFPLSPKEIKALNYGALLNHEELFFKIHESTWGEDVAVSEYFILRKEKADLHRYSTKNKFHLIYYDAFDPNAQPELWTKKVFEKLIQMLHYSGILVTYSCKGDVRRAMMAAGFTVKKLPGPPGKREMLRAALLQPSQLS